MKNSNDKVEPQGKKMKRATAKGKTNNYENMSKNRLK